MKVLYDEKNYLKDGESVLYSGKAGKAYFPVTQVIVWAVLVALTLVFDGFMVGSSITEAIMKANKFYEAILFIVALLVHLVPIGVWLMCVLNKVSFYKNGYVLITDKKVALIYIDDKTEVKAVFYENVSAINAENDKIFFTLANGKFVVKGIENAQKICSEILNTNA